MVDLSKMDETEKSKSNRRLSARSLSKNNYLTNLQLKYQGKNKSNPSNLTKPRNLKNSGLKSEKNLLQPHMDFAKQRFNYKTSKMLKNKSKYKEIEKIVQKIPQKGSRKHNLGNELGETQELVGRTPSLKYLKKSESQSNYYSPHKGFNSVNRTFQKKRSPIRNMKSNTRGLSPRGPDGNPEFSSKLARKNFSKYKKMLKSHKPVKKINVNLETVPQTVNLVEKESEGDDEVVLNTSGSSNTEFNVLSSTESAGMVMGEKPAVDPLPNLQKKLSKRINFLFN